MNKKTTSGFNFSASESDSYKIGLIIGQAPPEKEYKIPFNGTRLYKWFDEVGLDKSEISSLFAFDALVGKFPGKTSKGHNVPKEMEIQNHLPTIIKKIKRNKTEIVIPVGKLAIQYTLNKKEIDLSKVIGKKFKLSPFGKANDEMTIIPLPHPSGLSTWPFQNNNKKLLRHALDLIKNSISE